MNTSQDASLISNISSLIQEALNEIEGDSNRAINALQKIIESDRVKADGNGNAETNASEGTSKHGMKLAIPDGSMRKIPGKQEGCPGDHKPAVSPSIWESLESADRLIQRETGSLQTQKEKNQDNFQCLGVTENTTDDLPLSLPQCGHFSPNAAALPAEQLRGQHDWHPSDRPVLGMSLKQNSKPSRDSVGMPPRKTLSPIREAKSSKIVKFSNNARVLPDEEGHVGVGGGPNSPVTDLMAKLHSQFIDDLKSLQPAQSPSHLSEKSGSAGQIEANSCNGLAEDTPRSEHIESFSESLRAAFAHELYNDSDKLPSIIDETPRDLFPINGHGRLQGEHQLNRSTLIHADSTKFSSVSTHECEGPHQKMSTNAEKWPASNRKLDTISCELRDKNRVSKDENCELFTRNPLNFHNQRYAKSDRGLECVRMEDLQREERALEKPANVPGNLPLEIVESRGKSMQAKRTLRITRCKPRQYTLSKGEIHVLINQNVLAKSNRTYVTLEAMELLSMLQNEFSCSMSFSVDKKSPEFAREMTSVGGQDGLGDLQGTRDSQPPLMWLICTVSCDGIPLDASFDDLAIKEFLKTITNSPHLSKRPKVILLFSYEPFVKPQLIKSPNDAKDIKEAVNCQGRSTNSNASSATSYPSLLPSGPFPSLHQSAQYPSLGPSAQYPGPSAQYPSFAHSDACPTFVEVNASVWALESFVESELPPNTLLLWLSCASSSKVHLLRHVKYEFSQRTRTQEDVESVVHRFASTFLQPVGQSTSAQMELAVRPFLVSNLDAPISLH